MAEMTAQQMAAALHAAMCRDPGMTMSEPAGPRWGGHGMGSVEAGGKVLLYGVGPWDSSSSAIWSYAAALSALGVAGSFARARSTFDIVDEFTADGLFAELPVPPADELEVGDLLVLVHGNAAIAQGAGMLSTFYYGDWTRHGGGMVEPIARSAAWEDGFDCILRYVGPQGDGMGRR